RVSGARPPADGGAGGAAGAGGGGGRGVVIVGQGCSDLPRGGCRVCRGFARHTGPAPAGEGLVVRGRGGSPGLGTPYTLTGGPRRAAAPPHPGELPRRRSSLPGAGNPQTRPRRARVCHDRRPHRRAPPDPRPARGRTAAPRRPPAPRAPRGR